MARYDILDIKAIASGGLRGMVTLDTHLAYNSGLKRDALDDAQEISAITIETSPYKYDYNCLITGNKTDTSSHDKIAILSSDKTQLLINEHQKLVDLNSIDPEISARSLIELRRKEYYTDPQYDYETMLKFYNKHQLKHNRTYEFEKIIESNGFATYDITYKDHNNKSKVNKVMPLNDLIDVTIKSSDNKKYNNNIVEPLQAETSVLYENNGIPIKAVKNNEDGKYMDIYIGIDNDPVQICQFESDAFLLTEKTTHQPYYLRNNIYGNMVNDVYDEIIEYQLKREDIPTNLYTPQSIFGKNTYKDYFLSTDLSTISTQGLADFFTPHTELHNIYYNYIIKVNQNDIKTMYKEGDIHGEMMTTKNAYDPLYSMNMSSDNRLNSCRTYCGIQNSHGRPLLKYYDNVNYSCEKLQKGKTAMVAEITEKYPYQKVEYIYPGTFKSNSKHKSTLFSVEINNSGLDENDADSTAVKKLKDNIKKTISNAIRELADNICPANTQLFKVYYN